MTDLRLAFTPTALLWTHLSGSRDGALVEAAWRAECGRLGLEGEVVGARPSGDDLVRAARGSHAVAVHVADARGTFLAGYAHGLGKPVFAWTGSRSAALGREDAAPAPLAAAVRRSGSTLGHHADPVEGARYAAREAARFFREALAGEDAAG